VDGVVAARFEYSKSAETYWWKRLARPDLTFGPDAITGHPVSKLVA